ncbi:MAG: hypothetical protein ACLFQX_07975 [Candidatus Kapaibacterium sp.]
MNNKSIDMNIIKDELRPETFGEFIDSLIITNIRMWHAQELVYETESLERLSRADMFDFLKQATWLNLERNRMMEGLDSQLAGAIEENNPGIKRIDIPSEKSDEPPIREQI